MLKIIRVVLSILFFSLISFFFLDFTALLPEKLHALTMIQFIPALLTGGLTGLLIVLSIMLLTLLLGRIYCSSICPMGVLQDIFAWIAKRTAHKRKRYTYSRPKTILRRTVLVAAALSFVLGFPLLLNLIEPYSAFGRIAANVLRPVYVSGNNLLEIIFTAFGNYIFYKEEVFILSLSSFLIALATFLVIAFLAWKYGRTYCNTICPTGTVLGFLGRFSFFKVRINQNQCNHCGACATRCKSSCIDSKNAKIDYSRCVDCFNCLNSCKQNALHFSPAVFSKKVQQTSEKPTNESRRKFILSSIASVGALPAVLAQSSTDTSSELRERITPVVPPGGRSIKHLQSRCTACHLCVSRCPSRVLRPALLEYGLSGMMQPIMYFERGFCNFDCVVCTEVCPNGALQPLTVDEKHLLQVGKVQLLLDICIVYTNGTNCGACAEHCPTQAVRMRPFRDGLTEPVIDPDICVGCGGCEFICPVRPQRAIFVEGNKVHLQAKPFTEAETVEMTDDIGFGF